MKYTLIAILLLVTLIGNGQTWDSLNYNPDKPGLEENPLKGFVDLFNPENDFPRTINAKLFGLNEVMFGPDSFNWAVIDTFLSQSAMEGNHAYFQVNIDPGFGETQIPDYLHGLVEFEDYNQGAVPDTCPDWNNVYLMDAMLTFIDSVGFKYNNDPRVFMIHLGLYGIFGEWHIGDVENVRPEFAMTEENKILIANAYKNALPDKILLARYPENMPNPQDFGYSDGLFFTQSISDNPFNNGYFHYKLRAYNANLNWKSLPIGGEIDPCIQDTLWYNWPNLNSIPCGDPPNPTDVQDVQACFDSIRPTWLFSHHIFSDIQDNTSEEWANAIRAQKAMGYTFFVNAFHLSSTGGKPSVEINIQNKGLAPFYTNWEVEFGSINSSNTFKSLGSTKLGLDLIQPDIDQNYRAFTSDTTLSDGTYEFVMRVINPLEAISSNAKIVRFANETQDTTLLGWLTLGDVTITSGEAGVSPVRVASISISQSTASMVVGDILQLSATISPANATNQNITWVSNQQSTAAVDTNGLVTAGPTYGDALISAYSQDGNLVATCAITVTPLRVNIPAMIEAEDYIKMFGIVVENLGNNNQNLGFIDDRDWMEYGVIVSTPTVFTVDYRYSSNGGGGELHLVDHQGNVLDITHLPSTTQWFIYDTLTTAPILLLPGAYDLRLYANKGGFNLDKIEFKSGIPLLGSYTFLGTADDQYIVDSNWDGGMRPPNGYNGLITIQADCIVPKEMPFLLNSNGQLLINDGIELIMNKE